MVYGEAGIGTWIAVPIWTAGGGVEFAVGDALSVFAEVKAVFIIGAGYLTTRIQGGVNYHPADGAASSMSGGGPFDWAGLYFGALGGFTGGFGLGDAGVQVGYNMVFGNFLAGVEVETTHSFILAALINASLNARLGGILGDNFLVYGEAGIGEYLFAPIWTAGAGLEVGIGGNLSLFGEARAVLAIGGGYIGTQIRGGVNIHFGE